MTLLVKGLLQEGKWNYFKKRRAYLLFQIIIFGFLAVILVGTLLLMLPFASREPGSAPFLDALFTATSATCVTGLIVHDTATYWSCFGQVVILLLIQIGGMGVVTITIAVAMVSGKKIGLMQRSLMQESISAPQVGGIVRFTGFFLKGIALIELLGAILLAPVFIKDFGVGKGIWYGVFHSISAFCNAGFDLMGVRQQYSSLTYYAGNGLVNAVIVLLILIGGLGFLTWEDIKTNKLQFKKYRMQSKVILVTDLILVIVPTVIFYFGEFHGSQWGNGLERFWLSLFQAVTPRTAGFNTADFGQMSEGGLFLMVMLMLIGGAPGIYRRRYENDYHCSFTAFNGGCISQKRRRPVFWQTYSNGNRAVCGSSYADVYGALYSGRTVFMLCRRTACAHKFV